MIYSLEVFSFNICPFLCPLLNVSTHLTWTSVFSSIFLCVWCLPDINVKVGSLTSVILIQRRSDGSARNICSSLSAGESSNKAIWSLSFFQAMVRFDLNIASADLSCVSAY